MQSGFRSLICGLCCFAGAMASGPATPAAVKTMPAVLDNFDMLLGNQGATQNCIGAAKGILVNNSLSKAHMGKGYWYSYADAESEVSNADGSIPITASNFEDLVDTTKKCLNGKFTISTSSDEYPYAGIGCDLTIEADYLDLSKMTALSIKAGGTGDVRLFFKTKDFDGEDWGFYGADITLSATAKVVSIPVASLLPGEGSAGAKWKWSHGSAAVNKFHIQTISEGDDAAFTIDDITLVGMTYGDFGWQTSIITGKTTQIGTNPFTVSNSRINYSVALPQNVSIGLYNALGSRVSTLFSGNVAAGDHVVQLNLGAVASGNYVVVLDGVKGAVQPLTIAK